MPLVTALLLIPSLFVNRVQASHMLAEAFLARVALHGGLAYDPSAKLGPVHGGLAARLEVLPLAAGCAVSDDITLAIGTKLLESFNPYNGEGGLFPVYAYAVKRLDPRLERGCWAGYGFVGVFPWKNLHLPTGFTENYVTAGVGVTKLGWFLTPSAELAVHWVV